MSFNRITLVGNLGRDPELRYTPQGSPACSFSMATNMRRKDKMGEMQDVATWFRVIVWGRLAETAAQYLKKGRLVYVEGRLIVETWTGRDGQPFYELVVHGADVQFIDGRNSEQPCTEQMESTASAPDEHQSDLPN